MTGARHVHSLTDRELVRWYNLMGGVWSAPPLAVADLHRRGRDRYEEQLQEWLDHAGEYVSRDGRLRFLKKS